MPRVLVSDSLSEQGLAILRQGHDLTVDYQPGLSEEALAAAIPGADALVIRSGSKVTARVIAAATNLRVIGRAGIGVDNVDVPAASKRGVVVMNTPTGNAVTTAEHAIALLMSLARLIPQASQSMKAGKWEKKKFEGRELAGKTLGVVGYGRIGQATARICHHGFGMPVLYCSRSAAPAGIGERVDLETLLGTADYVSLNLPLTPETRHLLDRDRIRLMRPTAYLLNLGRGPLWDERAVLEALETGWIAGAGSDVFEQEPAARTHPLFRHRNFVCTPHMSAHTEEAMRRMSLVAEDVLAVLAGREPRWPAN